MRSLNKVIFINSADKSLPYAEVQLDGNVHFIGTQGVGKSTLLRAILFFYNADKQKLGIPTEKKKFDNYYFPYQNSYIIYEVTTETGAFCVFAFKSQGRVAFRFLNTPYDKNHFIGADNKAYENWPRIREGLGKTGYTRIINRYEEYRNILYGNKKATESQFHKYALLQSKRYQNIPRTISNVFLNAKLDAAFVKETIIKSLHKEVSPIDLSRYSETHLKGFKSRLKDIKQWTDTDRHGKNALRERGEKICSQHRSLKFLDRNKKDLAAQLGYALNQIENEKPRLHDLRKTEEGKRRKIAQRLEKQDDEFDKKKAKIQEKIGIYSGKLKEIKEKQREYENIGIDETLRRVRQKNTWELEKDNLEREKELLNSKYLKINERYEAQLRQIKQKFIDFKQEQFSKKQDHQKSFYALKERIDEEYEEILKEVEKQFQKEHQEIQTRLQVVQGKLNHTKIKQTEVKHKTYFKKDREQEKHQIETLNTAIREAENFISKTKDARKNLERSWAIEAEGIKARFERKIEDQQKNKDPLREKSEHIQNRIDSSPNSLYNWLNNEIPDWEETIGKVIDEDRVLFRSDLSPKKTEGGTLNFYGLELDTDKIEKKVTTLAELKEQKERLRKEIQSGKKEINRLKNEREHELNKLQKRFKPKIKSHKEEVEKQDYSLEQDRLLLKKREVNLDDLNKKAERQQERDSQKLQVDYDRANEEKIQVEKEIENLKKRNRRKVNAQKRQKKKSLENEREKLKREAEKIDREIQEKKQETDEKVKEIKQLQKKELHDKGADTKRMDELDLKLSQVGDELNFIEQNRDTVAEYKKDKRELFDREGLFKNEKKSLEQSLKTEKENYRKKRGSLTEKIEEYEQSIEQLNRELQLFEDDEKAFEQFKKNDIYLDLEEFITNYARKNKGKQNCKQLIQEIHSKENTYNKRYINFEENINEFTGNFEADNIFSFKVNLSTKQERFKFAENLEEFMEEDKISQYKKRVEERFAAIIHRIGKETGDLMAKRGEIDRVISDINRDFEERNFVGAIKNMKLKTDSSDHKIYQLLIDITEFNRENQFIVGETDLFSNSDQSKKNEKAIHLLTRLVQEIKASRSREIRLSDSFKLLFRIKENDNDTGWTERLSNVGSEGTDVLAKAMINIMLLNVFKARAAKKQKNDFRLHCMMDEIGKLHPSNVKGILQFANERKILLINSSPTSYNAADYRHTYLLKKNKENITSVKKIVSKKQVST